MALNKYRFYWLDKSEPIEAEGTSPANAFSRTGLGEGSFAAVDYYSVIGTRLKLLDYMAWEAQFWRSGRTWCDLIATFAAEFPHAGVDVAAQVDSETKARNYLLRQCVVIGI